MLYYVKITQNGLFFSYNHIALSKTSVAWKVVPYREERLFSEGDKVGTDLD